jgi:hypothetical protein
VRSTDCAAAETLSESRDPETILGPLLWLLTRLARERGNPADGNAIKCALASHLAALAAHPDVACDLRLAAGGLAIEYRPRATRR